MRRRTPARSALPPFTRDREPEGDEPVVPPAKKKKLAKGKALKGRRRKKGKPATKAMMGGPFASAVMSGK